ncbi:MAG TPA: hypothetical protein DCY07_08025 [Rhodospirillaceae bacterium]|nr:hypothetical protein [Rhodospirillaceae bacterium]
MVELELQAAEFKRELDHGFGDFSWVWEAELGENLLTLKAAIPDHPVTGVPETQFKVAQEAMKKMGYHTGGFNWGNKIGSLLKERSPHPSNVVPVLRITPDKLQGQFGLGPRVAREIQQILKAAAPSP